MTQSVYFDSQIIINISDGFTPLETWKRALEKLAGRFNYRVSFTTLMELLNALAGGDEDHFQQNRKRLLVLTDVEDSEFLPLPSQFIRAAVLGLPLERPEFAPERLKRGWMPALRQARAGKGLTLGNVVLPSSSGVLDLAVAIDLPSLRKEIEGGKRLWAEQLKFAKDDGKEMPSVESYAHFVLRFQLNAPRTQHNVQQISKALDAAYCHLAHVHHESTKGSYNFDRNRQDWIDNQQLMYLADPDLTFVTEDRRLIAKLAKSSDRHRVREFKEFANAV